MARKTNSLFTAIMTAAGTELEPAARELLTPIIVRAQGRAPAVAIHFGVSTRHAQRLLVRYGWNRSEPKQLARARTEATHYERCRCVSCRRAKKAA